MKSRKIKSSTKRAMKTRGGFSVPPRPHKVPKFYGYKTSNKAAFINAAKTSAYRYIRGQIRTGVGDTMRLWAISKAVDSAGDAIKKIGSGQGLFTYNPPGKGGGSLASQPGAVSTSISKRSGANGTFVSKTYKTKIEFGKKPSEAVQMSMKQNGTSLVTRFSSDKEVVSGNLNNALTMRYGFNQKSWWFPTSLFYPSLGDVANYFGDLATRDNAVEMTYGMCTKEIVKYRFYNSNTYFPMNIKVNLCSNLEDDTPYERVENSVLSQTANQQAGAIPRRYQFSEAQHNNESWNVHPKVQLNSSAAFRNQVRINKSVTQKLFPGDIWEVTMIRHVGAGWDLTKEAYKALQSNAVVPIEWFPLVEAWGVGCEGADTLLGRNVIGTSPGWINMEVDKKFELVNSSTEYNPNIIDGGNHVNYLVRVFRKQINESVLYNKNVQDISPAPVVDGFFIPVISDKVTEYAGPNNT